MSFLYRDVSVASHMVQKQTSLWRLEQIKFVVWLVIAAA